MSEVLGLDAVVAIHLAGVEQAAQAQPVQADGKNIPEEEKQNGYITYRYHVYMTYDIQITDIMYMMFMIHVLL